MALLSAQEMLVALAGLGMTDDQIAVETNVSQPTITRIRNGVHTEPRHSTWSAINDAYVRRVPPRNPSTPMQAPQQ